jgi:hypothetical protein
MTTPAANDDPGHHDVELRSPQAKTVLDFKRGPRGRRRGWKKLGRIASACTQKSLLPQTFQPFHSVVAQPALSPAQVEIKSLTDGPPLKDH